MMYDDTPEKGGARAHRYGSSIDYATITRAHGSALLAGKPEDQFSIEEPPIIKQNNCKIKNR